MLESLKTSKYIKQSCLGICIFYGLRYHEIINRHTVRVIVSCASHTVKWATRVRYPQVIMRLGWRGGIDYTLHRAFYGHTEIGLESI